MSERDARSLPGIARLAAKYGADLSGIAGTGEKGRVTHADCLAAIKAKRTADLDAERERGRAAQAATDSRRTTRPSFRPRGTVSAYEVAQAPINAMARNPLADQVHTAAQARNALSPAGSPPSLFAAGDTPAFTASGIPPAAVLQVPFQARHAMAAAPTAAEAYAIVEECNVPDAEQTAAMLYGDHPGNADYAYRVEQWRLQSLTSDQLTGEGGTGATEERERREAALDGSVSAGHQARLDAMARGEYVSMNGRVPGQPSDPRFYR